MCQQHPERNRSFNSYSETVQQKCGGKNVLHSFMFHKQRKIFL